MNPNYYAILGVTEAASPIEIKQAYRRMAMKYHPDRGGSHQKMLEINEAFGILYNSKLRSAYDFARSHQYDNNAQQAAAQAAQATRAEAGNYPREWSVFDKWLNGIAADFQRAEYGKTDPWVGPFSFPTAKYSSSANLFIGVGAVAGLVMSIFLISSGAGLHPTMLFPIAIGAWIGRMIHGALGKSMAPASSTRQQPPPIPGATTIRACPKCSQQLRVPVVSRPIKVKCTTCSHVFSHQ